MVVVSCNSQGYFQYTSEILARCNQKGYLQVIILHRSIVVVLPHLFTFVFVVSYAQLLRVWGLFSVFLLIVGLVNTFGRITWTLKRVASSSQYEGQGSGLLLFLPPIDPSIHPWLSAPFHPFWCVIDKAYSPPVAAAVRGSPPPQAVVAGPGGEGLLAGQSSFQGDGAVHTTGGARTVDGYSAI
jgi:hypothetical protein